MQLPQTAAGEKGTLQSKALFFVPKAQGLQANGRDLVVANLRAQASVLGTQEKAKALSERRDIIGASALGKIMKCQPVRYSSAVQFIEFINTDVIPDAGKDRLTTRDIVACVFRPVNLLKILAQLDMRLDELSRESKVDFQILNTMGSENWRYQLSDLLDIRDKLILRAKAQNKSFDELTERPEDFITTFCKPGGAAAIATDARDRYIYSSHNLRPAEKQGHPWALPPESE
ncbi:hypothetical protein [Methylorubrum thiocyanatum]